jgi:hypothetical protein
VNAGWALLLLGTRAHGIIKIKLGSDISNFPNLVLIGKVGGALIVFPPRWKAWEFQAPSWGD